MQLLQRSTNLQERNRHAKIIRFELGRMAHTIQRILESTHSSAQEAPVDLNKVVHHVQDLIGPTLSGKPIVFKAELAKPLPSVRGNEQTIGSVILNLVKNAVQAMPEGGELLVRTCQTSNEYLEGMLILRGDDALAQGGVRLIISDTGHGIPSDCLRKIFEPLFTTRQATGGTGLGLAICHRVVGSAGGRMAVCSTVGHGTRFIVDWPIWTDP
jgi:signal transduction histidine kinase